MGVLDSISIGARTDVDEEQNRWTERRKSMEAAVTDELCKSLSLSSVDPTMDLFTLSDKVQSNPQPLIDDINQRFGINLPVAIIEEQNTPQKLADEILRLVNEVLPPLERPYPREPQSFPLSHIQVELWFRYQQLGDEKMAAERYTITRRRPAAVAKETPLVQPRMQRLFQQQAVLRSILYTTPAGPMQTPVSGTNCYFCPHVCLQRADSSCRPSIILEKTKPAARFRMVHRVDEDSVPEAELSMLKLVADYATLNHVAQSITEAEVSGSWVQKNPATDLQYVDFAKWQVEHQTTDTRRPTLQQWLTLLDAVEEVQLPLDRNVVEDKNGNMSTYKRQISSQQLELITMLCEKYSCDFKQFILSVFYAHVDQMVEQNCIAIATFGSLRMSMPAIAELMGTFDHIAILPLMKARRSFSEIVQYIKRQQDRIGQLDVPAQVLSEFIVKQRLESVSEEAFTKLFFSYEKHMVESFNEEHLPDFTQYALEVQELPNNLSLRFSGGYSMFSETVAGLVERFMKLLDEILKDESTREVSSMQCVDAFKALPSLQEGTIQSFSKVVCDDFPSKEAGLGHRILESIGEAPLDCGLVNGKEQLSFDEVKHRCYTLSDRAKQQLISSTGNAFTPGTLMGVMGDETVDAYCGVLGSMLTGGAYVPISLMDPPGRKQHILKDATLSTLLTKQGVEHELPEKNVYYVDRGHLSHTNRPVRKRCMANGTDLAYLIYTSGTTGVPKGVAIQQGSIIANCIPYAKNSLVNRALLQGSRLTFDPSVAQIVTGLMTGCTTVVPTDKTNSYASLRSRQITSYSDSTPTSLLGLGNKLPNLMARLENLSIGGEAIPGKLLEIVVNQGINTCNFYGPTEGTDFMTMKVVKKLDTTSTVGKPVKDCAYVIDTANQPVAVGQTAECFIMGDCLATGYFNSPEKTANAFQPNPFQSRKQKLQSRCNRMYRSGDKLKWFPDGNLICLGRNDQQIKLRGLRLELEEIESLLCASPLVSAAAVVVLNDESGKPQNLAAAYVRNNTDFSEEDVADQLKTWLAKSLPPFVVPAFYVQQDSLPTTNSGKLDRRRTKTIVEAALQQMRTTEDVRRPHSHLEVMIMTIWSEVLNRGDNHCSSEDNFFAVGGNSLLTLQLQRRINEQFNLNIKVTDLFRNQTGREMARLVAANCVMDEEVSTTIQLKDPTASSGVGTMFCLQPLIFGAALPYFAVYDESNLQWPGTVFGVEHPNTFEEQMPNCPFEVSALLDLYIKDMFSRSVPRPMAMIGLSMGGLQAHLINERLPRKDRLPAIMLDWDPFLSDDVGFLNQGSDMLSTIKELGKTLDHKMASQLAASAHELWLIFYQNRPRELLPVDYPAFNFFAMEHSVEEGFPEDFNLDKYIGDLCKNWNQLLGRRVPYDMFPGAHMSMIDYAYCAKPVAKVDCIMAELDSLLAGR